MKGGISLISKYVRVVGIDDDVYAIYNNLLFKLNYGQKMPYSITAGKILFGYGMTSVDDFIAESIAEYMTGTPRPLAKQVVELLLEG